MSGKIEIVCYLFERTKTQQMHKTSCLIKQFMGGEQQRTGLGKICLYLL
ncbi:protein of unknown function [Xenorhabdus poinarii G6]|uniref:Uncharacterized protein n=1 Tax=Xenorhabdus poinarii G6 TaxID=1354304 RepID=A0A068R4B1_9GAMM|nr:protein of unknown function [Xenorhabdus poinarii G6]